MPLETATYINQLEPANPAATDQLRQADDHLRLIKQAIQNTFPNLDGPVTLTADELNAPTVIPVGVITAFFGAEAPAGWAICDGREVDLSDGSDTIVTPDLRDRVLVGASPLFAPNTAFGALTVEADTNGAGAHTHTVDGGSHTHTGTAEGHALSLNEIPQHTHFAAVAGLASGTLDGSNSIIEASNSGGDTEYSLDGSSGTPSKGKTSSVGSGQAHTHDISLDASTHSHTVSGAANHTHTVSMSVVQPSFALHMIMKV